MILSYLCNTVIGIENVKSFHDFSVDVLIKLEVNNVVFIRKIVLNQMTKSLIYSRIKQN